MKKRNTRKSSAKRAAAERWFLRKPFLVGAVLVGLGVVVTVLWRPETTAEAESVTTLIANPAPVDMGYVGSAVCAECHAEIAEKYRHHPMGMDNFINVADAHAVENYDGADCPIPGPRRFRVERNDQGFFHHEILEDAQGKVLYDRAEKIRYVVGSGQQGRSFVIDRDGVLYQSPLTWYMKDKKWSLSPGYRLDGHHQLKQFSRRLGEECLRCHVGHAQSDQAGSNRYANPAFTESFISCERCHGPGKQHVELNQDEETSAGIVNPASLAPRERDSVCYQCHMSSQYVTPRYGRDYRDFRPGQKLEDALMIFVRKSSDAADKNSIASQAEQMESSRCYLESNGQMGCISCHDAHSEPTETNREAFYRARCIECHQEGSQSCALPEEQQAKSPASGSCIHCHMPTSDEQQIGHIALSDHRILRRPTIQAAEKKSQSVEDLKIFAASEDDLPPRELDRAYGLMQGFFASRSNNKSLREQARKKLLPPGYQENQDFETALDQIGDDIHVLKGLASTYAEDGRFDRALACFLRGLQVEPHNDMMVRGIVDCYEKLGQTQKAIEYLRQLQIMNPHLAASHRRLPRLLLQAGHPQAAIQAAEEAVALNPLNHEMRVFLIQAYQRAGQAEKSQAHRTMLEKLQKTLETP